jgi:hypothetical protein
VDHTFQSEIRIKNIVQNASVTVRPVLFMADGTRYELSSVKIAPSGVAVVSINDALDRASSRIRSHVSSFGSAELNYVFGWQALTASVAAIDPIRSLSYNTAFSAPATASSASSSRQKHSKAGGHDGSAEQTRDVEGLWWKRDDNVGAFVFLSNLSTVHTDAVIDLLSSSRQVLSTEHASLNPHESRLISFDDALMSKRNNVNQVGGLSIRYPSSSSLAIAGGLENSAEGYSASIPFTVESPSGTQPPPRTVASVGIMNGTPDPMMMFPADVTFAPYAVLRNPNSHPAAVTPTVYYPSGSTWLPLQLPPISLDGGESRVLDVATLLKGTPAQTAPDLHLTFTGPADLLVATGSVDETGTFVFEVQPDVVSQSAGKSLCYWKFSETDGTDTMVTLWNHSDAAQDIVFTLLFASGQYAVPVHLEPKATDMFNVSDLIMNGTPDTAGHTVPMTVTEGSASITGGRGELDTIDVTVDASVFNVRTATCGPVCHNCQGYAGAWTNPSSEYLLAGNSGQLQAVGQWQTGAQFDLTSRMTWSSSNPSVASVSAGALVTSVIAGSADVTGEAFLQTPGTACGQLDDNGDPILNCPILAPISVGAPTTVDPTVSINAPLGIPTGASGGLSVTINSNPNGVATSLVLTTTSGTGDATFNSGAHNISLNGSATVPVKGVTASSTANNISVRALGQTGSVLASATFSVVSVSLSLRSSSALNVSPDNAGITAYQQVFQRTNLGAFDNFFDFGCKTGAEIVGTVTPSNYTGPVILRRTLLSFGVFDNTSSKIVTTPADDTSDSPLRDDDPQSGNSGGKVYDLDAPGSHDVPLNDTVRVRQNFSAYAVLDSSANTVPVSTPLAWFSAVSCTETSNGPVLDTTIPNDNKAGIGTVNLSANLQ